MARHLARDHVGLPGAGNAARAWPTWARPAPSASRPRSATSARSIVRVPAPASTRCSAPPPPARADFGVVPVENSTEGVVARSLDLFLTTPLHIVGETSLLVRHNLLRKRRTRSTASRPCCAHPQALAQCQGWLTNHLPDVERRAVSSNAEGARLAGAEPGAGPASPASAPPASSACTWPPTPIQDDAHNRTRFAIVCLPQTCHPPPGLRQRLHQPGGVGAQPARRRARHAGAAEGARRVDDALRVAPGAHRASGSTTSTSTCRATLRSPTWPPR